MRKHLAIVIDWFCPYFDFEELNEVTRDDYSGGLYVAIGKYPINQTTYSPTTKFRC